MHTADVVYSLLLIPIGLAEGVKNACERLRTILACHMNWQTDEHLRKQAARSIRSDADLLAALEKDD